MSQILTNKEKINFRANVIKNFRKQLSMDFIGDFPKSICSITNETIGVQEPDVVNSVLQNKLITVTQKLDGHSCSIIIENKKIKYVCSRKNILKETPNNKFWQAARKLNLDKIDDKLYVLQGELMGPGLVTNQLELDSPEIFIFQIKYNNKFYPYLDMVYECRNIFNCKYVPHVDNFNTLNTKIDLQFLQNLSNAQTLPNGEPAEGIVIRPLDYPTDKDGKPFGFKIINKNYSYLNIKLV